MDGYTNLRVNAEVTNIEEVVQEDPTDEEAENVTAITSDFSKTVSRASTGSDYESSGATFGSSYNFLPPTYVYSTNSGLSYASPSASESLDTSGSSYEPSPTSTFSCKVFIASGGENWVWTPGIETSAAQNGHHEPVAVSQVGDEVTSDGEEPLAVAETLGGTDQDQYQEQKYDRDHVHDSVGQETRATITAELANDVETFHELIRFYHSNTRKQQFH